MNDGVIRPADEGDAEAICEIYNWAVLNSTATFQLEPVSVEERRAWLASHSDRHPVIVMERRGRVCGWGSLSAHRERAAYANTVESSIYVHPDHHRTGVGRALMQELIAQARVLSHHTILAGISMDQPASIGLHESLGFRQTAHFRELGFKFGKWVDVGYWQLML